MPHHPIVHEYGLARARFEFLWCHFHPSYDEESRDNSETTLGEEDKSTEEEERIDNSWYHTMIG